MTGESLTPLTNGSIKGMNFKLLPGVGHRSYMLTPDRMVAEIMTPAGSEVLFAPDCV